MRKFIIYLFIINALTFAQETALPVESSGNTPKSESKEAATHSDVPHNNANDNAAIINTNSGNSQKAVPAVTKTNINAAQTNANAAAASQPVKKTTVPVITKNTAPVQNTSVNNKIAAEPALRDSVNISAMVQNQIEAAESGHLKTSSNFQESEKPAKKQTQVKAKKQEAGVFENIVKSLNDFNKKYLNLLIFIIGSTAVLSYFFGKRFMNLLFGKSKRALKKSINQIRNEKPVFINNKKLYELRSKLAESNNIYDISEESIPGKARNMNVGKGEIMLAAKIKAFQLSKISK